MIHKTSQKNWNALTKKQQNYLIEAGWFENSRYSNGMPIGGIAAVQNYGATINNPGGQPYYINSSTGLAVFVKKDSLFGKHLIEKGQITKPHTIVIPPTHFMEKCKEENKDKWKELAAKAWGGVFTGKISAEQAMEQLGLVVEGDIAKAIKEVNSPPLSHGTIEARKNRMSDKKTTGNLTKRLVDTGEMFDSVSHKVKKK